MLCSPLLALCLPLDFVLSFVFPTICIEIDISFSFFLSLVFLSLCASVFLSVSRSLAHSRSLALSRSAATLEVDRDHGLGSWLRPRRSDLLIRLLRLLTPAMTS